MFLAEFGSDAYRIFEPSFPPFFPDGRGKTNLRLSFSNVDDELIDVGIGRLAHLLAAPA